MKLLYEEAAGVAGVVDWDDVVGALLNLTPFAVEGVDDSIGDDVFCGDDDDGWCCTLGLAGSS